MDFADILRSKCQALHPPCIVFACMYSSSQVVRNDAFGLVTPNGVLVGYRSSIVVVPRVEVPRMNTMQGADYVSDSSEQSIVHVVVPESYPFELDAVVVAPHIEETPEADEDEGTATQLADISLDDPVRMYLQEIGKVRLLRAADEVMLAHRIEMGGKAIRVRSQRLVLPLSFVRARAVVHSAVILHGWIYTLCESTYRDAAPIDHLLDDAEPAFDIRTAVTLLHAVLPFSLRWFAVDEADAETHCF